MKKLIRKGLLPSRHGENWSLSIFDCGRSRIEAYVDLSGSVMTRTGLKEEGGEIAFVDPPGGPFIGLGFRIWLGETYTKRKSIMLVSSITHCGGSVYCLELRRPTKEEKAEIWPPKTKKIKHESSL